jgi:phenylalanyl-tRNA synthetase alpha chain
MPNGVEYQDLVRQTKVVYEAFERDSERFNCFLIEPTDPRFIKNLQDNWQDEESLLKKAEAALRDLQELQTLHTGKKSSLAALRKMIGKVEERYRGVAGQEVQGLNIHITSPLKTIESKLKEFIANLQTEQQALDVTLPGRRPRRGHLHPITILRQKIEDIFVSLGYAIEDDREIETDFYNFTALNIPDNHPARDPLDTFYTTDGFALRSQTSTVQIHAMERRSAPLRMIAPGRVFRRDTPDATHNPMFYQVEGLCVDRGITMAHLKGTLSEFVHRLVGPETRTRFRPSYFPFTEPSAEVDYSCFKCNGAGCRICKQSGWIELGGSGMVHPNVLSTVGINPEDFSGFAFGFGIDRMSALMYKLDDIRLLFENDVRFLEQFN